MLNKNGYVLVYAIGVIAILILLTSALTNITMTRSLWASKNIKEIQQISDAKTQVEAAASDLANYFDTYVNVDNKYLYELNAEFQTVFDSVESKYGVTVVDVTANDCAANPTLPYCKDKSYTYEYEIEYTEGGFTASQRFFLSMIPSFLYFALGSSSDLTLNGGSYIDGDIYVRNNLYITDVANYIYNSNYLQEDSTFPTVNSTSNLYLGNNLYSCHNTPLTPCYTIQSNPSVFIRNSDLSTTNYFTQISSVDYSTTFVGTPPIRKTYTDKFLDVNFDASYIYYIDDAIGDTTHTTPVDLSNISTDLQNFTSEGKLYPATTLSDLSTQSNLSVIYNSDLTIDQSVSFTKDKWIIVNGNLEINYKSLPSILVNANFLVTGNVVISGNVQINSTIYALGKGLIHDASINNSGETTTSELVLLTKDVLQFSKINQFDNNFSSRISVDSTTGDVTVTPDIRGFFYTERNVQIYTVDSYIAIEGGIYANDGVSTAGSPDYVADTNAVGLVINSYRGAVTEDQTTGDFIFQDPMNFTQARLVVVHDSSIIENQPNGLPLNKEINYIFEGVTVK